MKRLRRLLILAIIVVAVVLVAPRFFTHLNDSIEKRLLSQYPFPVLVSPDGQHFLVKSRNVDDFEIKIVNVTNRKVVTELRSPETQLALAWSPNSKEIAFLSPKGTQGNFYLTIWNFETNLIREFSEIYSNNASYLLQWSPSGDSLLMYRTDSQGGVLSHITGLIGTAPSILTIDTLNSRGDFAWSPGGDQVAYLTRETPNILTIRSLSGGEGSIIRIPLDAELQELSWSGDSRSILASVRNANDPFYKIVLISLDTKLVQPLIKAEADLRHPVWLADNKRFFVERVVNGVSSVCRSDISSANNLECRVEQGANQKILSLSLDGRMLYMITAPFDSPQRLEEINLNSPQGEVAVLYPGPQFLFNQKLMPEHLMLKSSDGMQVPTIFWKPSDRSASRAIIIVHGGPHLQEIRDWDARIQLAVDNGYMVVAPNYRGSKGYGAIYEKNEDIPGQVNDIAATVDYIVREYAIPRKQITVIASSYGTLLARELIKKAPKAVGNLVLLSLFAPQDISCPPSEFAGTINLYHGERDMLSPLQNAQGYAQNCLNNGQRGVLTTFANEGHHFHRTSSWVKIYQKVLSFP